MPALAAYSCMWLLMADSGCLWLRLAAYGCFGCKCLLTLAHGYLSLRMAASGGS